MKKSTLLLTGLLMSAATLVSAQTLRIAQNWPTVLTPFYKDILQSFGEHMKDTTFELVRVDSLEKAEGMLASGKVDLVAAVKDKNNKKKFRFTYPFLSSEFTYLTRKSEVKKVANLKGKVVCVTPIPPAIEMIESIGAEARIYPTAQEMYDSFFERRCSAAFSPREANTFFMRSHPQYRKEIRHLRKIVNTSQLKLRFAVSKENVKLQRELNKAIGEAVKHGCYKSVLEKHFSVL